MAIVTMLEKARQGRRNALASLNSPEQRQTGVESIFDFAFDEFAAPAPIVAQGSNVIAFRSARTAPAPATLPAVRHAA